MKQVFLKTADVKTALKTAGKLISKNSALPILENFMCEVQHTHTGQRLKITSTDLENSISVFIPCQAAGPFSFTLPSSEVKLIEKLDAENLTLTATTYPAKEQKDFVFTVELTAGKDKAKAHTENPLDFPLIPCERTEQAQFLGTVYSDFFPEIKLLAKYAGKDDLRPAMTGVFFELTEAGYILTATDAHILRTSNMQAEVMKTTHSKPDGYCGTYSVNGILPAKFCKLISAFDADFAHISTTKGNIWASFLSDEMEVEICSRLIDAQYPNYRAVIPHNNPISVTAKIKPLVKLLSKAALYSNKVTKQVNFSINGDIKLTSQDLDFSREYSGNMEHENHTGADIEIGFNADFVTKVLNDMQTDTVTIQLSTPTRAGVVQEGGRTALLMPVMINN